MKKQWCVVFGVSGQSNRVVAGFESEQAAEKWLEQFEGKLECIADDWEICEVATSIDDETTQIKAILADLEEEA